MYIAPIPAVFTLFGTAVAIALEMSAAALSAVSASGSLVMAHRCQTPRIRRAPRSGSGRNERGEGVISAAIAVLIIASLGALMWVGFKALWENAEATTNSEIAKIGK